MAKKTFRFAQTIGVPDPETSTEERRDTRTGIVLVPASLGLRHVLPGEPVEMEDEDGKRLGAKVGFYKDKEVVVPPMAPAVSKA